MTRSVRSPTAPNPGEEGRITGREVGEVGSVTPVTDDQRGVGGD
jgi:hypothetical protein